MIVINRPEWMKNAAAVVISYVVVKDGLAEKLTGDHACAMACRSDVDPLYLYSEKFKTDKERILWLYENTFSEAESRAMLLSGSASLMLITHYPTEEGVLDEVQEYAPINIGHMHASDLPDTLPNEHMIVGWLPIGVRVTDEVNTDYIVFYAQSIADAAAIRAKE